MLTYLDSAYGSSQWLRPSPFSIPESVEIQAVGEWALSQDLGNRASDLQVITTGHIAVFEFT